MLKTYRVFFNSVQKCMDTCWRSYIIGLITRSPVLNRKEANQRITREATMDVIVSLEYMIYSTDYSPWRAVCSVVVSLFFSLSLSLFLSLSLPSVCLSACVCVCLCICVCVCVYALEAIYTGLYCAQTSSTGASPTIASCSHGVCFQLGGRWWPLYRW